MSSPPPTKPPRGVKQGKETSGLLMSVIRTLSASETNEQREKERAKLEKEYKKSDARLDELVAAHAQEIQDVMQKFSTVSAALTAWGVRGEAAAGRVAACRGLLRLRRDDLKRLWTDARTHHYALMMLTDIERVVVSEREAREALSMGRVLAASQTLSAALTTADTTLSHVTALNTTRLHLEAKKRELVEVIVRRISDAVYRSDRAPLTRTISARRRTNLLLAELTKSSEVTDAYLQDITPEFEASLTEEDSTFETTAMISLEALGVLDQLKQATEKFKVQIQNELLEVIESVSRRILDEGDADGDSDVDVDVDVDPDGGDSDVDADGAGRPLARLVICLGDEFRACGARNRRLLQLWRAALQKYKISDTCLHTEQHYWSAVQQVLQLLLTEYLEIESVNLAASRSTSTGTDTATDLRLGDYFAKKRPPRRRTKLFKLAPCASVSVSAASRRHAYPLVCKPRPALLHAVLPALHALANDIEARQGGGECSLRVFISNYVRAGESERLAACARASIERTLRYPDAWRERTAPPHTALKNSKHVLVFTCVCSAWRVVCGCVRAARRCGPAGGSDALRAVQAALAATAVQCRAWQSRVVGGNSNSSNSVWRSARWLSDDDIVRFLQSLPNWTAAVHTHKPTHQELNQAYEREAEILGSSLGDGAVSKREIISDVNTLADIAIMCESMDWLSANIKTIPSILSGNSASGSAGLKLSDKFCNDIAAAAAIFDEISHKCLLLLHLELRIQCFHYLGQEERGDDDGGGGADGGGAGGGAPQLARALLAFHDHANVLQQNRLQYVIGGLGEMMSSAVVWRWQEAAGASTGGAVTSAGGAVTSAGGAEARLASLRHCLAALRLPHTGLQRAHLYLHLLHCTPEEIVTSVREKGAQFSELEYLNAFKLIGARLNIPPADMRGHLKELSAALGHVGVTV